MIEFFSKEYSSKNRFIEIDSIRGISAVIILLIHYSKYLYNNNEQGSVFLSVLDYGKYTVPFFFVLSGFLIFMTLDKLRDPKSFVVSRFARLYPAYWVCMSLTAIAITISPYYHYQPVTIIQYIANLTMFQHWMFIEDMDGAYWTLAVEMTFYILIFLVFIFKKQKHIESIGLAWLAVMLIIHVVQQLRLTPQVNYYYLLPLLKNGNLFLGGILFYQLKVNPSLQRKYRLIALCLLVHFVINSFEEALAISIIFLLLFLFVKDKLKILKGKIPFFLGYICYPLYLLHQYIGYELMNMLQDLGIYNAFLKILIAGSIVLVLATVVTFTVERPAMRFFRRRQISVQG